MKLTARNVLLDKSFHVKVSLDLWLMFKNVNETVKNCYAKQAKDVRNLNRKQLLKWEK